MLKNSRWNEDWVSLSVRRGRLSYLGSVFALWLHIAVPLVVVSFVMALVAPRADALRDIIVKILAVAVLISCVIQIMLIAQRLRDIGLSGWFSLLIFVAFAVDVTLANVYEQEGFIFTLAFLVYLSLMPREKNQKSTSLTK